MVKSSRKENLKQLAFVYIILFGPIVHIGAAPVPEPVSYDVTDPIATPATFHNGDLEAEQQSLNCSSRASASFPDDFFTWTQKRQGGVVLHILLTLYAFGALAMVCSYYFMSALETICTKWNLSHDVAGATFMAFGTSAPEIATSVIGVFVTESNVGLDTVAGSTVYNMLCITALVALLSSVELPLSKYPIIRDTIGFVATSLILMACCLDGVITWYESVIVVMTYVTYIILMVFNSNIEKLVASCTNDGYSEASSESERRALLSSTQSSKQSLFEDSDEATLLKTRTNEKNNREWDEESNQYNYGDNGSVESTITRSSSLFSLNVVKPDTEYQSPLEMPAETLPKIAYFLYLPLNALLFLTIPDCNRPGFWRRLFPLTFIMSVVWIAALSYLLVWMVEVIGETFFIPESIMGISFLAIGTSIPDTLASVLAAKRGYNEMAVSNILGSNILDLTSSGLPWLIKSCLLEPGTTVFVGTKSTIFTILSLLVSSVIVIIGFMMGGWSLGRRIGYSFLLTYCIYVAICCLYELNYFGLVNLPLCPES